MGTNESWLAVKVGRSLSSDDLATAVVASYESRGGRFMGHVFDADLPHGAEPARGGKLGVLVSRAAAGWVTVVDSHGVYSDARLAADLAKRLETTVFRRQVIDSANYDSTERFGIPLSPSSVPSPNGRYQDGEEVRGNRYLLFNGVSPKIYDSGAVIRIAVRCTECGYRASWSPGIDVPSAPSPDALFPLSKQKSKGTNGRVLIALHCPECDMPLGFAEGALESGLLVSAKKLGSRPKPTSAFDWALEKQRKAIEELGQVFGADALARKVDRFNSAFAKDPRRTLEASCDALTFRLNAKKPKPLSWIFAPDREQLFQALKTTYPAFAWRPVDLPGDPGLHIVAWLGPVAKGTEVVRFLNHVKQMLKPGSFARHGRDPKTMEWMTALGFALPDGTWAGLTLFEQLKTFTG